MPDAAAAAWACREYGKLGVWRKSATHFKMRRRHTAIVNLIPSAVRAANGRPYEEEVRGEFFY